IGEIKLVVALAERHLELHATLSRSVLVGWVGDVEELVAALGGDDCASFVEPVVPARGGAEIGGDRCLRVGAGRGAFEVGVDDLVPLAPVRAAVARMGATGARTGAARAGADTAGCGLCSSGPRRHPVASSVPFPVWGAGLTSTRGYQPSDCT